MELMGPSFVQASLPVSASTSPSSSPALLEPFLMTTSEACRTCRWLLSSLSHWVRAAHHHRHLVHLSRIRDTLHLHEFHHLLHLCLTWHSRHIWSTNSGHRWHSWHRHGASRIVEKCLHLLCLLIDRFYLSWHCLLLETIACPSEFIEPVVEIIRDICARFSPRFRRVRKISV